jgi:hypothetical protein
LLVPAAAIGPTTALVPAGVGALCSELGNRVREIWLVGGVGRVLPARLFTAAVNAGEPGRGPYDDVDDPAPEPISLERFDRVAGPRGLESVPDAVSRPDCPVVPELLRPLD